MSLARGHLTQISQVKERWTSCLYSAGFVADEEEDPVFSVPDAAFGFGLRKLHKTMQDKLRGFDARYVDLLAEQELRGDDQRRLAFKAASDDMFANAFPLALAPDEHFRFNRFEFITGITRKLGLPIPLLLPYVGTQIKTEVRPIRLLSINLAMVSPRPPVQRVTVLGLCTTTYCTRRCVQ